MKKGILKISMLCMFFCASLTLSAEESNIVKFVKGNITDKISAVKNSSGKEASVLSSEAVDFILQNIDKTGSDDRDMNTLAVTGILALSAADAQKDIHACNAMLQKLYKLFSIFSDTTIRISIIDKIVQYYEAVPSAESVQILSSFLNTSMKEKQVSDVQKTAINALGKIGDGESFVVLYECLQSNIYSDFSAEIKESLASIADKSLTEILQIINNSDVSKITEIFTIIKGSDKISPSFKAEIAENVLSEALYITEKTNTQSVDLLEFDAFSLIIQNNWTRASALIIKYFEQSKKNYQSGAVTEQNFIDIINGVSLIATAEASETLSKYLAELNSQVEKGKLPSEPLILSLIKTLGDLGSKTAFDPLLYVTYLDYPENIIAEARKALTKLKW